MPTIVYVTSDPVALRQVSDLLDAVGLRLVSGGDGSQPVPPELAPDLVLLDTRLAGAQAPALVARLRRETRGGGPPLVLVLADREEAEAAVAASRAGADDVVFRPLDPLGLPARIQGLLMKRALQDAEERVRTAEFRNQELESFIYIVTHDMKTPVVNLQGLVGLLEQDHGKSLPPEAADYLVRLRRNATRLEELLRDLLEYPSGLRLVASREPRDTGKIVAAAVDGLKEPAAARGVEITVADDLPVVACDQRRLQQVFHNLIDNAIKHANGAEPKVQVGWTRTSDGVRFEVRDNGKGIAKEHLDDVFRLFHRVPGTTSEGTGIGLAVAQQLVEAHGGEIWAESKPGEGTTFAFTLENGRNAGTLPAPAKPPRNG